MKRNKTDKVKILNIANKEDIIVVWHIKPPFELSAFVMGTWSTFGRYTSVPASNYCAGEDNGGEPMCVGPRTMWVTKMEVLASGFGLLSLNYCSHLAANHWIENFSRSLFVSLISNK